MRFKSTIPAIIFLLIFNISTKAQLPEEIKWKHLEKIYTPDSSQLILKLNGKTLEGKYKIPFDEGGFALYSIKNGKISGDAFWYSPAGNIECKLRYRNGVRNGLKENYDKHGKVWLLQEYKDGKQHGLNEMYSGGQLSNKSEYENGKKAGTQYTYSSGKLLTEVNYLNDLREGLSKTYMLDGTPITEINYTADKQNGLTTMYAMGYKSMDFIFENGLKHGISHMYKPDGGIIFTNYYLNGEKVSKEEFQKYKAKIK